MKRKLIFSTSKPNGDPTNIETIYKISHKDCNRKQIMKVNINDRWKLNPKFDSLDFGLMDDNEPDIIEEERLNILNNHSIPLSMNLNETIDKFKKYENEVIKPIGWHIAEYILKNY